MGWMQWLKKFDWLTQFKLLIGFVCSLIIVVILIIFPPFSIQDGTWSWNWTGFSSKPEVSVVTEVIETNGTVTTIKHTTTQKTQTRIPLITWVNTLIVPFSLTILGYWFQEQQGKRAGEQAILDKEIAYTNLCEEALQAYFDRLAELLIDKKLATLAINDPVQEIALNVIRARTLSILRQLGEDGQRKGNIVRFLIDAELMGKLNLSDADFRNADLAGTNLENADLRGANLENAKLENADLRSAKLENAKLENADLRGADLENIDLREANLKGTNLVSTKLMNGNLKGANLENANLKNARLENANMRNVKLENANLKNARLENANLSNADMKGVNLEKTNLLNADLANANLLNANLLDANLAGADLRGADLRGVLNLNITQIEAANNEIEAIYDQQMRELLDLSVEISSKEKAFGAEKSNFLTINRK
jgi:uncharacterized protein YjbI with pentapeptide repeats